MKNTICLIIFFLLAQIIPLNGAKKVGFEIFLGINIPDYNNLYLNEMGTDNYIKNYSEYLNLPTSQNGAYSKIKASVPISLTLTYPIKDKLNLRGSVEYNSGNASGEKTFSIEWPGFIEDYQYSNGYKVVSLITMIGLEYNTGAFAFFLDTGINFGNISHTSEVFNSESGITYSYKNTFKGLGNGLALSVGAKYKKKMKKLGTLLFKIELFFSRINSIPGTMVSSWADPVNGDGSDSTEGNFYIFETNPYGTDWFEDMKFYQRIPQSPTIRNIRELDLNFSAIKFGLGFGF